jgi:hypothetical protein
MLQVTQSGSGLKFGVAKKDRARAVECRVVCEGVFADVPQRTDSSIVAVQAFCCYATVARAARA